MHRGLQQVAFTLQLLCCGVAAILVARLSWAGTADGPPDAGGAKTSAPGPWLSSWFNPATAPFIPIPEIAIDPDSGTTLGIIPTWVKTDENHDIRRIIAPDVLHNPFFGYGMHARIYGYTSTDEQWSVVTGIKQRVEREFDAEYQKGRLREGRWSFTGSLIYDRDGTPRFYGVGNDSPVLSETNYTKQSEVAQAQVGLNLSQAWQLLYTGRLQVVDVLPGTLERIATLEKGFGRILGVNTNKEFLNRLSLVYDSRDNLTVPTRGMQWVAYGGLASRNGLFNNSLYSEAGVDGRAFWPITTDTVLAAHMALRYLLTSRAVPFWALSSIGGGQSAIGGEQPLRGFGAGRFYDRNSFSSSVEVRRKVLSFNAISTHVEIEVTPFVDVGRVFARDGTFPLDQLHHVFGVGFRGVARPFVVGYVDIGYGSEGVAVFTGLNYPF